MPWLPAVRNKASQDKAAPASHQFGATPAPPRDAEQDTSGSSEDDDEESSSPPRVVAWARPARLLRPVRRLMEIRQLCPHMQLMQSFVGGNVDDDSDEEHLERAKQLPAAAAGRQGGEAAAAATPYWPPASWAALERQSPAPPSPARRGRSIGSESGGPRRLGVRRRGGQAHFVDQSRAAAFSTVRDIKITLQRRTLAGKWPVTEGADWRTLASEAETAYRRQRFRYAASLFSKQGEIRLRLGRAESLARLRRFSKAGEDARWVRQKEPDNATAQLLEADALLESGEPELALVRYHCGSRSAPGHPRFAAGVRRCEGIIKRLMSKVVLRKMQAHAKCPEMCWKT
ncbi:hypothetical protein FJT64_002089 [Amphibalanus amphitrite]|uniref:Tetratricopeptide repeat protein 25 n=1 Tax=Amphibalanus amphitrite TaxID=1232801 RepID=A0A6A4WR12_AMPAM|nr:hypothetical protein FJT64_002089 [Amphibalanus amphitrite]